MGRIFMQHMGGHRLFICKNCSDKNNVETNLTNRAQLISTRFTGSNGRAFLFDKVVNLTYSKAQAREMLTGRHMVRDVFCKKCEEKLGWMYEYAVKEDQKYKEGKIILERTLVHEIEGIEEYNPDT